LCTGETTLGLPEKVMQAVADSNPCFSLERVVTRTAATWTYGAVATGGCHHAFEWDRGDRFGERQRPPLVAIAT
jgi:hypothetical protein